MSYILDALRKSEQQRQAATPENVTERILIHAPPSQQRNKLWWLLLILVNLLGFASLFGYLLTNKPEPKVQIPATASTATITPTAPIVPITPIANNAQTAATEAPSSTPSIADMLSAQESTARSTKLSTDKKPVAVKKVLPKRQMSVDENRRDYIEEYIPPSLPPYAAPEPNKPELAVPSSAKKSKLTINVFSYAQQPEERFVIINMTKYKVGQQIDGETQLKEIHPDHIVLQQGGTVFKMNRP